MRIFFGTVRIRSTEKDIIKEDDMKKKVLLVALFCAIAFVLTACTQADNVRYNLKREADDFNVRRRITVLNTRTDTPMMQITGLCPSMWIVTEI